MIILPTISIKINDTSKHRTRSVRQKKCPIHPNANFCEDFESVSNQFSCGTIVVFRLG
eukprot:m.432772 g.432772  ORF g.432772 m.432772 type:complete len:58 (+) comp21414_c1_seq2:1313-1486(+)